MDLRLTYVLAKPNQLRQTQRDNPHIKTPHPGTRTHTNKSQSAQILNTHTVALNIKEKELEAAAKLTILS